MTSSHPTPNKSVVATADSAPNSLRSGRSFSAVPHFKRSEEKNIEMNTKSLVVATIILACGGCKNSEEALADNSSRQLVAPQSRAVARIEVESVSSDYCSEFRIHEVTMNKDTDGSFEVSGKVPTKKHREYSGELNKRLEKIGWNFTGYQIQFSSPEQFLWLIRPNTINK